METTQTTIAKALLSQAHLSDQDHQRLAQLGYFPISTPSPYTALFPAEDDLFWEPAHPDEPHPYTPSTRRKRPQKYRRKDGERALEHALMRVLKAHEPRLDAPANTRQEELLKRWRSVCLVRAMYELRGVQTAHHAWHVVLNARDAQELSGHVWVLRRASIAKAYNLYRAHLLEAKTLFELNRREHQRLLRDAARGPAALRWSLKLWHAAAQHDTQRLPFLPSPLTAWAEQPDELDWLDAWYDLYFLAPHTLKRTLSRYLYAQRHAIAALAPPPTPQQAEADWRSLLWALGSPPAPPLTALMWPMAITVDVHPAHDQS